VGEKTPSTKITEEYAKADPTYVQKTMVRPWQQCFEVLPNADEIRSCPRHTRTTGLSGVMGTVVGEVS